MLLFAVGFFRNALADYAENDIQEVSQVDEYQELQEFAQVIADDANNKSIQT